MGRRWCRIRLRYEDRDSRSSPLPNSFAGCPVLVTVKVIGRAGPEALAATANGSRQAVGGTTNREGSDENAWPPCCLASQAAATSAAEHTAGGRTEMDHHSHAEDLERYRRAAEDALQQLDWAIGYLHRIRKNSEAKMLSSNRQAIRTNLLNREPEPEPA